jgi:hypothetical protein
LKEVESDMPEPAADEAVRRAEEYPFDLPFGSYQFRAGACESLSRVDLQRRPVLAIGANGAPSQLTRKFGTCPEGIPVTRAIVYDHAVVFSAHLAAYGAVPATLVPHRGSCCWVFVTWLAETQMPILHASEGIGDRYDYVTLEGTRIVDEFAGPLRSVGVYVSRSGPLLHQRAPIRVAEVPTTGCQLPALIQRGVLRWVHRRLAPLMDYACFVRRLTTDASFRRATNVALRGLAGPAPLRMPGALAV